MLRSFGICKINTMCVKLLTVDDVRMKTRHLYH